MFASHYFTLTLWRISQCFRYSKFNMKMKNIINLLLICWGVFACGVSLTLLTPFYPSEALSKVGRRFSSPLFSSSPQFAGSHSDPVRRGPQHSLCSHAYLHSNIWKGIYQQFCCWEIFQIKDYYIFFNFEILTVIDDNFLVHSNSWLQKVHHTGSIHDRSWQRQFRISR